jgi:23S rRNA pseudouridine1911/1915/1917 synthase
MRPTTKTPSILYEDNHLLVAVKPPGVLSQAGDLDLPDMLTLLKADLKVRHEKPGNVFLGLVHRLDVNVGGVMVFAKTSKAAARLSEQIRERVFEKRYLAVVDGTFESGSKGQWNDTMRKDARAGISRSAKPEEGKDASLSYRVLAVLPSHSQTLLEVVLETGRFHQIRMQFSSRGVPLVGDAKYGSGPHRNDRQIGLWAYRLGFLHPVSGLPMKFHCAPQGDLFELFRDYLPTQADLGE